MGFMPFQCTMLVVERSVTMPPFLLPKWNEVWAIPPYIDYSGRQL